jgi:hypothetical protein
VASLPYQRDGAAGHDGRLRHRAVLYEAVLYEQAAP